MSIRNLIQGASAGVVTTSIPEGVDFDGTNDYLSRSSDLVGNVDSKTFTFSAWVYLDNISSQMHIISLGSRFLLYRSGASTFQLSGFNTAGGEILRVSFYFNTIKTFNHILISLDLNNTPNRAIYINDTNISATWTFYSNELIDFTNAALYIASDAATGNKLKGRLSHVFIAREYIDLSVEANRRIFITADGKPA